MRILFIAPRLPLPADTGGKIRTWNLLKQVSTFAQVHLVCFSFENNDLAHKKEIEQLGISLSLVPPVKESILRKIYSVAFHPLPYSVAKYCCAEMSREIQRLIDTQEFDSVHIDHIHMVTYQKKINRIPCLVDEHNVEYRILERCANVENSFFKSLAYKLQAQKMKQFEAQAINSSAVCTAVSQDDADLLRKITGNMTSVYIIPNGVDTAYFQSQTANKESQEDALVYTGSMDWLPNEDAVLYFIQDIWPLIRKQKPNVKFYVVGKNPSAEIQYHARKDKNIIVTGIVKDVRPYVEKSKIFIVPLRIGGGTRLKILEAMSMGKIIVSTRIGAEGIQYTENKNIFLADTPEEFADKVHLVFNNSGVTAEMARYARELVCQQYDWSIVGKKLLSIYEKL